MKKQIAVLCTLHLPSDPLVENLTLALTCGHSSTSENTLQIPRGCVAEQDIAQDRVRWQQQLQS